MSTAYESLREHIIAILSEGRDHSRRASDHRKAEAYWHVGDAIFVHVKDAAPRAEYGHQIHNLSKDIGLPESTLHDIVRFRRAFSILSTSRELTWSHYRVLIRLPGIDQRRYYERAASEGHWSVRQLESHVADDPYGRLLEQPYAVPEGDDPLEGRAFRPRRGQPYTYRLIQARGRPDAPRFALDLGFHVHFETDLTDIPGARAGLVVNSQRDAAGEFRFIPNTARRPKLWTYPAWVDRVIDGDTLLVTADLGFSLRSPQRLRLRGIDTPELRFPAGVRAREFAIDTLSQVDFIVLSTTRTDRYGRYLADIFYLPGEPDPGVVVADGNFLNRQLLEERHAVRYA